MPVSLLKCRKRFGECRKHLFETKNFEVQLKLLNLGRLVKSQRGEYCKMTGETNRILL